ncbi:Myb domain-contaning protein [Phytophthora palmivora]|uniref:Myb domain-contaning protein n=1 Tax=Phytophthora palmivora TaxID=4796 RepID=A0A2P4WWE6_9STRA|nr:Myb domain-contaning protein [Phytophthora palmivora]
MAERHQVRAQDSKFDGSAEKKVEHQSEDSENDEYDDLRLSTSSIIELDRKDLLIVKDGTVRVAESLDREQQQLDANGEVVKASGTWTKAEHERFLRAMETFPKGPWKAIAEMVATRTVRQTQTHAQKYREKLARRMRGLRNRNGTLQTPPMSVGMVPGVGYPQHVASHYANVHTRVYQQSAHLGAMGYTSMMTPLHTMAASTIPLARATSLPAMPLHSSPLHHHHTTYASTPMSMSASVAMVSSEFSQLSTSTISNAFIGNASYPASWEGNGVEVKQTVPDFDESMDFLMDVYSTNPSQINTAVSSQSSGMTVTPTACNPRTPQTPTTSMMMKRHPGYMLIQEQQKKHFPHVVNREQQAKGV